MAKCLHVMAGALRAVWRFRLRSTLILLSAALGVAGVIDSVDFASGGSQQILDQIRRLGANVLIVTPQQSRSIAGRGRTGAIVTTLTEQDYAVLRRELGSVKHSSALATSSFVMKAGKFSKNAAVFG